MSDTLPPFLATEADAYEHFMGRWSARLAEPFLDFAGVTPGHRTLDVGCGTGTTSLALAERGATAVGMDASESYLEGARLLRSHANVTYEHGDACHLTYPSDSFDACVSTLAIDVIAEVDLVAAEMRRVTRPGGVVACCTFDFWGGISVLDLVLDTGAVLDEGIRSLRSQIRARPIVWANGQADLWRRVGLVEVVQVPIVLSCDYSDFEDYWSSFSTGPSRIAQHLTASPPASRREIEEHVRAGYLAGLPDGPRSFAVVVRAVRGTVPR
jgi:SAM-dependent methyltransferase